MCQLCLESNEKMEPADDNIIGLNREEHVGSSVVGTVSPEQVTVKQDSSSPQEGLPGPATLISSDSIASNCSDYSVDVNPGTGHNPEAGQDDSKNILPSGQLSKSSSLVNVAEISGNSKEADKEVKNGYVHRRLDSRMSFNSLDLSDHYSSSSDESSDERSEPLPTFDDKIEIWDPPEAENADDEKENNVTTFADDDDECADGEGTEWAKSSSLNNDEEGVPDSNQFEEEKNKAMEEVMNGRFKNLVRDLLKKVDIDNCDKEDDSWVDIVTLLAWQAASFVKPEATEGKTMDPAGYVKIKCIASGSRHESQLIRGLVFKKHPAHKHMATKYKNPRLLLIQGTLDSASSGLSSFNSMIPKEKENVADIIQNLKACHPNVVFVEKSALRDVVDEVVKLGVTLVLDMKLTRLERIARCTGSSILPSDGTFSKKLKHCDSLYFEKFVEEHAVVGEGGKKPCKTLMFLEGCPTHLGCTILLKGSQSEELKKIKCVIKCAVIMAYHFILETSFLADQHAMFSTIAFGRTKDALPALVTDELSKSAAFESANSAHGEEPHAEGSPVGGVQISISNGSDESAPEEGVHVKDASSETVLSATSNGFHEEVSSNAQITTSSSITDELRKVSVVSPATFQNVSTYIDMHREKTEDQSTVSIPVSLPENGSSEEDKVPHDLSLSMSALTMTSVDARKAVNDGEDSIRPKDEISSVLDSESILVLMSSRNATKGTICDQSHFSQIKFYKNFDVPLGKFLQDNLFNQSEQCKACGGLPEAHFYYYAHHNKQLTIRVKRLNDRSPLPGESEGKLWMWSRCGKCEPEKDKATKRVLISTAARGLSFGKFLELSFSSHSSFNRLSSCGHSLQKDFLYFFGLGSMVAMFRYSRVATYSVSVPAPMLEFNSSSNKEWLQQEIETVYTKGLLLFTEVANYLKKLEPRLCIPNLFYNGSSKTFADISDMLKLERSEFEENIKNTSINNESSHAVVHKLLSLNRLRWEILLEAWVWDQRLQHLLSLSSTSTATAAMVPKQMDAKEDSCAEREVERTVDGADDEMQGQGESSHSAVEGQTEYKDHCAREAEGVSENCTDVDIQIETSGASVPGAEIRQGDEEQDLMSVPILEENDQQSTSGDSVPSVSLSHVPESTNQLCNSDKTDDSLSGDLVEERSIPVLADGEACSSSADKDASERLAPPPLSKSEELREWIWSPFARIQEECMKDLRNGSVPKLGNLPKFELLNSRDFLPTLSQVITEEGSRLHVPLSDGDFIVSDYDGEISTSVACALALTKERESDDENATLQRASSEPLNGPLNSGSYDPDMISSTTSMPPESRFSSFDGLNFLDTLNSYGPNHPEVNLGVDKNLVKGKYSVVVMYAKDFRNLRKRCCPSELDYIASLSRCKIWDAKGGKSKSVFAKTLDDRLIIKEIKKTEFESFMKFADAYFRHMKESFASGNQTCLAKILGIYQVTIRNPKSGKESKHDLMVQENLSYGRNITRQYDLKGALHARFTATADGTGDVLLDQNFVNDMNSSPLYIAQKSKRLLQRAVWNDTTFLNSINVMDYSLLVGVDRQKRELICGIIDYLRQYTWDKQFETWVKASLVVPKNVLPTIISPKEYKKRFRKFMDTHFLTVPDHWCSQRSANPCKLCGIKGGDDSSYIAKPEKPEKRDEEVNGVASP